MVGVALSHSSPGYLIGQRQAWIDIILAYYEGNISKQATACWYIYIPMAIPAETAPDPVVTSCDLSLRDVKA